MSRSVVILGGGLQGLSSAFFLSQRGADITVVDHGSVGGGASRGNAGYMCTTILEPLANPTAIPSALKSLKDPTRALRLDPTKLPNLAGWFANFARHATAGAHRSTSVELVNFNRPMQALLDQMAAAGIDVTQGKGLVVPFHDEDLAKHWGATMAPMAELLGKTPAPLLDGAQLRAVVPALSDHINAGYVLETERSLDPRRLVDTMIAVLRQRGVRFVEDAPIRSFDHANGHITSVKTAQGIVTGDEFVLAVGASSRVIGKQLGIRLPVVSGQGYNVALPKDPGMDSPVIFEEAHAAATPFADQIRLGGTMEFAGDDPKFDGRRVDAIINSMRKYVNLDWDARTGTWAGCRPMTADGKPYIGRPRGWQNVIVAAGHGMFGLSLAPVTGKSVSEMILDGRASSDLSPFHPNRR
jgi:D-amino-acid dehydrogenase